MEQKPVFRSTTSIALFATASAITLTSVYAFAVDGARHIWLPATLTAWLLYVIIAVRDAQQARSDANMARLSTILERVEEKLDLVGGDVESHKRRTADLHERLDTLTRSINEFGQQRQIAGHLAGLHEATANHRVVETVPMKLRAVPDH